MEPDSPATESRSSSALHSHPFAPSIASESVADSLPDAEYQERMEALHFGDTRSELELASGPVDAERRAPRDAPPSDSLEQSSWEEKGARGGEELAGEQATAQRRGAGFYMIVVALCVSSIISAIDMTGLGTILPTIAADLNSTEYSWIGSAFVLTSTAVIPVAGSMASIFGRRATLLFALGMFFIGSAICGSAPTMSALIAGRAVQGIGGGSVIVMTEILIVDLVPLAERGAFFGIIGATWSLSAGVGSPIGGALAQRGQWRYFFYLNLPILVVAFVLVAVFLKVKTPTTTFQEKLAQMDWANIIFVASTTSAIIAMSWAGDTYLWSSWRVIVLLTLGMCGLGLYIYVEKEFVSRPTIPFDILRHPLSLIGYLTNFVHGMVVLTVVYYLPTYYQACRGASPIRGGVDLFSLSFTIAPFGMIAGIVVTVTAKYKWLNVAGWVLTTLGLGLMTTIHADSPTGAWVGFPVLFGCGAGILFCAPLFPILAPLDLDKQPHAMVFHAFTRLFGNTWGVAVGITVLQDQLKRRLPASFIAQIGRTNGIVYAAIPSIPGLAEPIQSQVKGAYAHALSVLWIVMTGLSAVGLLASLFLKDIGLAEEVDPDWGLDTAEFKGPELTQFPVPTHREAAQRISFQIPPGFERPGEARRESLFPPIPAGEDRRGSLGAGKRGSAVSGHRWSTETTDADAAGESTAKRMSRRLSAVSSHALRL